LTDIAHKSKVKNMGTFRPLPKHDFVAKIRQPSILPRVLSYIEWQKNVRKARALGITIPDMPNDVAPFSINLDPTTACSYDCGHCCDLDILNLKVNFEHQKLLASLQFLIDNGLRSVILIGGGEPTLYPKFPELVHFLKERDVNVAIVSNGWKNKILFDVADCLTKGDWIRLSLDSGTNDTFMKMHKPKVRKPDTLEEICKWVPRIRDKNPDISVGFSYIVTWDGAVGPKGEKIIPNIDEVVTATRLARENRFNYIAFKPFLERFPDGTEVLHTDVISDFEVTLAEIRYALDMAKVFENENFKVVESTNLRVLMARNWRDFTKQPTMCHKQALQQVLTPLGLYNCPAYRGAPQARIAGKHAYSDEKEVANARKETADILDRFDASQECANITCLYNSMNWWVERAIRGELDPEELTELEELGDYFF
jgi:hypothetical protein